MEHNQLIVLKQEPIIEFSAMEARGLEVSESIKQLNIDTIKSNESSRSMMKKMRATLNKELEVFENQRKMIHGLITKPYKAFSVSYDSNIKSLYIDATKKLKAKIDIVEYEMLSKKIDDIESYFNSKNKHDFLKLESVGLNIILSASNKKLTEQVDLFISAINSDVEAINKMEHSIRIMSLYRKTLNSSLSISTVLSDIEQEKELVKKQLRLETLAKEKAEKQEKQDIINAEKKANERAGRKKQEAEELKKRAEAAEKQAKINASKESEDNAKRLKIESEQAEKSATDAKKETERLDSEKVEREKQEEANNKMHGMNFKVSGTIAQLKQIKEFLIELGVNYE